MRSRSHGCVRPGDKTLRLPPLGLRVPHVRPGVTAGPGVPPRPPSRRHVAERRGRTGPWVRGRGWALSMAVIALPYYRESNPAFADLARHVMDEVLIDLGLA